MTSPRRYALERAADLVDGDRDAEYGGPEQSFERIAALWSAYKGIEFTAIDVAGMMACLKLARIAASGGAHRDSWLDLAGYGACGFEVAGHTES